jgi:hypothetical protein
MIISPFVKRGKEGGAKKERKRLNAEAQRSQMGKERVVT